MTLVVDASVGLKWLVKEEHSGFAYAVLAGRDSLIAPPLFRVELASAVRKKIRLGELPAGTAQALVAEIADVPVFEMPTGALLLGAMSIALRFNRSIYDSLYVALALQERCALVTADRRLYDAVAPSYPETMLWIEDVPLLAPD